MTKAQWQDRNGRGAGMLFARRAQLTACGAGAATLLLIAKARFVTLGVRGRPT